MERELINTAFVFLGLIVLGVAFVITILLAMMFRIVVPTNDVNIVQSGRKTVSYGKDQAAGNVYYAWPSWVPHFGVKVIRLPVSVFDINLSDYAAYDKGRVPFVVDIMAFFRVADSNMAAQRVSSFDELTKQLKGILQGASRSILAQAPIEEILEKRAEYGKAFTDATNDQLKSWGVVNVKNIELMDIRDSQNSRVISNIMAMKQSQIEKESRVQVANNQQMAASAEIEAKRQVAVNQQIAEESVGIRTAQKDQQIGVSQQKAAQQIKEEQKLTTEKDMNVKQMQDVRTADIERQVHVVEAERTKQVAITVAEGDKQQAITVAEGQMQSAKLHAQGVEAEGKARGAAETAWLMAPVTSQITLAKEIGENEGYQSYLVKVRQIEAGQAVGVKQAEALAAADIKVISNVGTPTEGLSNVMELFSAKGGLAIGSALEAVVNTPTGRAITDKLGITNGAGTAEDHQ